MSKQKKSPIFSYFCFMQIKARETLARWALSRKFSLTVAYWAFCFVGAAILYLFTCETVEQKIQVFNDALEWALYGFYGFIGVEGAKEGIGMIKKPRSAENEPPLDQSKID